MELKNYVISGKDLFIVNKENITYLVKSGSVNVYVTYFTNNKPNRRIFLCECSSGDVIPSLMYDAIKDGTNIKYPWRLVVKAIDKAVVSEKATTKEDIESFIKKTNVKGYEELGYEESIVEKYRIKVVHDARNIYVAGKINKESKKNIFYKIYSVFNYGRIKSNYNKQQTTNSLYNTASSICEWMGISYVPFKTLSDACSRNISIQDFARLSGFACRDIVLEENWYKQDAGPILTTLEDTNEYVACLPYRNNRYVLYTGKQNELLKIDDEVASNLSPNGYMFYRPFPREKMDAKKLIKYCLKEVRSSDVLGIILFAILCLLIGLLLPYVNEQIYDLFIPLGDSSGLVGVGAVVIACTSGNLAFSLVQYFCNFRLSNRLKYSVEAASLDRLFSLPESFFNNFDSADLAKRTLVLPQIVQMLSSSILRSGISFLLSLFYLFGMFNFSSDLSWAAIIMLLITSILIVVISNKKIVVVKLQDDLTRKNASLLYQIFTGINKLRISNAEDRAIDQYINGFIEESKLIIKSEKFNYVVNIISLSASTIFSIVFYFMIVKSGGSISIGKFVSFNSAFGSLSSAVLGLAQEWVTVNSIIPLYEKSKPILEELPEKSDDIVVPNDIEGNIEVNNLTFGYDPDASPVIDNISLSIKAGEYIGIVGSSGCGKSTLMKLLLGFEKPQKGKIYYDGQDIDFVDKRELRKMFGVVLQNGGLLTGSISDNITISKPNAKLDDIEEAVRSAGLEDDIKDMPMGLHTVLSEGSGGVSGGQKQRILIARAIVGKPKVLFFDEATSALDNNTQNIVCDSLEKLNATRIVIAHRLSTIMNCDRIFVLNKGKIVEEGNYKELMDKKGLFFELASRQIA